MNIVKLLRQRATGGAAPSPLLTDLVSYWKLDETAGTRIDSAGSNNLSDNGGVGSGIGKQGNAAVFDGTARWLDTGVTARPFELRSGDTLTIAFWMYPTDNSATYSLLAKFSDVGTSGEYAIRRETSGNTLLRVYSSGSQDTAPVTTPINTWSLIVAEIDGATSIPTIYNVGAGTSGTRSAIIYPTNHTKPLTVGAFISSTFGSDYYAGRIDEVGIWSRVLTASERTQLYNGGAGITYPFV
jgi:hypothetical protein